MACPKLQLTDEVFGPPLLPAAGIAKRGEWVDLVRQDGVEKSTDVTGVTVRVKESTAQHNIEVATTVGGVVKRKVLGWSGGSADELVASRFPNADFLVIRHVVDHGGATARVDVRGLRPQRRGGGSASNPIMLGPFQLPAGVVQLQFCPDPSGRLILLWNGYPASAMGRIAAVYRSDMDAPSTLYSLIDVDAPGATGYIACKVETTPAPGLFSLYDHASLGAGVLSLPAAAAARARQPAGPEPGPAQAQRPRAQLRRHAEYVDLRHLQPGRRPARDHEHHEDGNRNLPVHERLAASLSQARRCAHGLRRPCDDGCRHLDDHRQHRPRLTRGLEHRRGRFRRSGVGPSSQCHSDGIDLEEGRNRQAARHRQEHGQRAALRRVRVDLPARRSR